MFSMTGDNMAMDGKENRGRVWLLAGALLLAALFLRLYRVAQIPLDMHIDEAGLGLNAWSLANFGTDRYGNFLPVCPSNFYGEQSAFYTYLCALFVRFFGLSPVTLRLPGVIMGVLAVFFGALIVREKWGERGLVTGLALLGIFPYFIMNCRFALDCNAMLGTVVIALYSLLRLVKKAQEEPAEKLYGRFALVGMLLGIVLYTYIIAAIAVALFGIFFGMYYLFCRRDGRGLRFRQLLFLAVPLTVMAVPLALVVCVNYFGWEPVTTPFFSIPRMAANRAEEIGFSLSALPGKLRGLLHTVTTDGKYGSSDRYWTMYRHSVPLVLAGFVFSCRDAYRSCRDGRFGPDICMLFLGLAEGILFLLCGQYNYHINGIFVALAYFCVNGIFSLLSLCGRGWARRAFAGGLAGLYAVSFVGFAAAYYGGGSDAPRQVFGGTDEALSLLEDAQKEGDIYVLDEVGEFYFLSNPVAPDAFSAACDELGYVRDYQNLHFHEPEVYLESDVYVCSRFSGRAYFFSDAGLLGHACDVLETPYYYVFYSR